MTILKFLSLLLPPERMEDLWKDITLSSLHHASLPTPTTTPQLHHPQPHHHHLHIQPSLTTNIFQDFLARPFSLNIINTHTHTQNNPIITSINNNAPPQTILSLNNNDHPPDSHLGGSSSGHSPPPYNPFDYTYASAHHQHHKRHILETECDEMNDLSNSQYPFDRRHKRMIMNRESAARSRARKQAYTTELELQVARLKRENAGLRMEQEVHMHNQAAAAAAMDQSPKKHKLHRTSTAPF